MNYGCGTNRLLGHADDLHGLGRRGDFQRNGALRGNIRPEQPLSDLFAEPSGGTWKLRVTDDAAIDVGTIGCFTLKITHP